MGSLLGVGPTIRCIAGKELPVGENRMSEVQRRIAYLGALLVLVALAAWLGSSLR
jgi:hypothetical protein